MAKEKQIKKEKIEEKKEEVIENKAEEAMEKIKEKTEEKKPKKEKEAKEQGEKVILEREYIIPLRRGTETVPGFKKARKAIKVIKEFLVRHMLVRDRDTRKIKINIFLNNEIWFRGIKNIPSKIKVKARKYESGIVEVELADIPEAVKWKMQREDRRKEKVEKEQEKMPAKKHEEKTEESKEEKTEESKEEKTEEKEKEAAVVEAGLKHQKQEAKQMKHMNTEKPKDKEQIHRQVLER